MPFSQLSHVQIRVQIAVWLCHIDLICTPSAHYFSVWSLWYMQWSDVVIISLSHKPVFCICTGPCNAVTSSTPHLPSLTKPPSGLLGAHNGTVSSLSLLPQNLTLLSPLDRAMRSHHLHLIYPPSLSLLQVSLVHAMELCHHYLSSHKTSPCYLHWTVQCGHIIYTSSTLPH